MKTKFGNNNITSGRKSKPSWFAPMLERLLPRGVLFSHLSSSGMGAMETGTPLYILKTKNATYILFFRNRKRGYCV